MEALFGETLQGKDGEVSTSKALSGAKAVALYFSAHWCGPCRGFTPEFAKWYTNDLKAKGLEVVFVSSDKDDSSFKEYFAEQPWLALPYSARDKSNELSEKFEVSGIPSIAIVDSEGNTITTDGRSAISEDPKGEHFPWKPMSMTEIWEGVQLVKGSTRVHHKDAFEGKKAIALYFSAHWCSPCRGFTPKLAEWYRKDLQSKGLEVVFVSSDRDENAFKEYYGEQPWLALDFADRRRKSQLSKACKVNGIPSLAIIDPKDFSIINLEGRAASEADPEGNNLPWVPKAVRDLSAGPGPINDTPTLLVFCETATEEEKKSIEAALMPVAQGYLDEAKAAGNDEAEMNFVMAKSVGGLANRIRGMMSLETSPPTPHEHPLELITRGGWGCDGCNQDGEGKKRFRCTQGCDFDYCEECKEKAYAGVTPSLAVRIVLVDIPADGAFYVSPEGPITQTSVTKFISDYKAGSLDRKQLA